MYRIALDAFGKLLPNGTFGSVCRIGGTHDFPPFRYCTLALKHHHHSRSFGHESNQPAKKRPLLMNFVKGLGFSLRDPVRLKSDDAEPVLFNQR